MTKKQIIQKLQQDLDNYPKESKFRKNIIKEIIRLKEL
tara:strand:+ start:392 stop:505 length:114 start_codon:yes stop_codon:yes gene_type:complete